MGMWNKARLALLLLGAIGLWWSTSVMPVFRSAAPVREVTERVIADQRFKPGALSEVLARMERQPKLAVVRASYFQAEALVRLGIAERAMGRQASEDADGEVAAAEESVRTALKVNPSDSFLWLMLYSVYTVREGFAPENIRFLDESYATGPYEGWISLRRIRVALSIYSILTKLQQQRIVGEFARMVDTDFIDDAVSNLTGVGWAHRDQLLGSLAGVDIASRQSLAKQLSNNGYKVRIPGIDAENRPW